MSELIDIRDNRKSIRLRLLATASVGVLLMSACEAVQAYGEEADRPQVWIELGGQFSLMDGSQQKFVAPYFATDTAAGFDSPASAEKSPRRSIDEYGKLTIQPDGSDWSFSAGIRYGRSSTKKSAHQQTPGHPLYFHLVTYYGPNYGSAPAQYAKFSDTQTASSQTHLILDFQAGKDVGMGLFGRHGTSTLDFGVRFAQFTSKSRLADNSDPKMNHFPYVISNYTVLAQAFSYPKYKSAYWSKAENETSFHGIGPSLSWHGTAPLAGNPDSAEIDVDWGVNGAVLFGKQKSVGFHQSSKAHCSGVFYAGIACNAGVPTLVHPAVSRDRSRNVVVPNIGGSLGLSFRSGDAKVNFGYRADVFFNVMDSGIDVAKSSNIFFHGPYASVSIGLGG